LRKQKWRNKAEEKQLEGRKLRSPGARDLCPNRHNHFQLLDVGLRAILDRSVWAGKDNAGNEKLISPNRKGQLTVSVD
jgi:hypothetical protein